MGNTNSRPFEPCSEEMMTSLSDRNRKKLNQFDFFEAASQATLTKKLASKSNNSQSSASTAHSSTTSQKRTSITSSVLSIRGPEHLIPLEYETSNNRSYVSSPMNNFYLPVDDDEVDRLVVLHFLLKYAFNGNLIVEADHLLKAEGTRVLDVGCGPGTWILEMATEYPRTEFYGVDIRLMFPTTIKPSNAKFTQYNFIESLPYEDNTFDIVRMRLILGFLTEQKMVQVFKEIYRVLKPSGYVEILDCEYQVHRPGPLCLSFVNQTLLKSLRQMEIEIMPTHQIGTLLMTHGNFVDIHQHRVRIPIGWGGHLGEVHGQDFQAFIRSIHPKLIRSHLSTDLDESMAKAVKECALNQSHVNWFVCYGQKPTNPLMPSNIHTQQDIHWDSATVHDDLTNCYYEEEI